MICLSERLLGRLFQEDHGFHCTFFSQSIIYGAQAFNIECLWNKIAECKDRGAYVMLSINSTRESKKKDISVDIPSGLFEREMIVNCGTSMIDRLQNSGKGMTDEVVHDKLLLTW